MTNHKFSDSTFSSLNTFNNAFKVFCELNLKNGKYQFLNIISLFLLAIIFFLFLITLKLNRKYRIHIYSLPRHRSSLMCVCVLGFFFFLGGGFDESTVTHHYYPKFITYIRIHCWCHIFYGVLTNIWQVVIHLCNVIQNSVTALKSSALCLFIPPSTLRTTTTDLSHCLYSFIFSRMHIVEITW